MKSLSLLLFFLLTSSIVSVSFALTGTVKDAGGLPLGHVTISYNNIKLTTSSTGAIIPVSAAIKNFTNVNDLKDIVFDRTTMVINLENHENPVQVKITTLQGKQIYNKEIHFRTNGKQTISLNDLNSKKLGDGLYFVNVYFNNENHLLSLNTIHNSASILSTSINKANAYTSANKYSSTAKFEKAGYETREIPVQEGENVGDVVLDVVVMNPTVDAPFFAKNYFFPGGWWSDNLTPKSKCILVEDDTAEARSGSINKSYYKFTWTPGTPDSWQAVTWYWPDGNIGSEHGHTVTNAKRITFWVKSATAEKKVTFSAGDKNYTKTPLTGYNNSFYVVKDVVLTTEWTMVTLDLSGADLSNVIYGFTWAVNAVDTNELPLVLYINDIIYE